MKRIATIMLAVLALAACGGDSKGPLAELGESACVDLRNGLSFFQIASSGLDSGLSRKQVASALTLGVEDDCPEFRDEYRKTAIWTEWQ